MGMVKTFVLSIRWLLTDEHNTAHNGTWIQREIRHFLTLRNTFIYGKLGLNISPEQVDSIETIMENYIQRTICCRCSDQFDLDIDVTLTLLYVFDLITKL